MDGLTREELAQALDKVDGDLLAAALARRNRGPRYPAKTEHHICAQCGTPFASPRVTRKYCSRKCNYDAYLNRTGRRVRRWKDYQAAGEPYGPEETGLQRWALEQGLSAKRYQRRTHDEGVA